MTYVVVYMYYTYYLSQQHICNASLAVTEEITKHEIQVFLVFHIIAVFPLLFLQFSPGDPPGKPVLQFPQGLVSSSIIIP